MGSQIKEKYKLSMKKWVKIARIRGDFDLPGGMFLYQIEALRDIPRHGVKAGDKGGYVNKANILSHEGDAWIGKDAVAIGRRAKGSYIYGNAFIEGKYFLEYSRVSGNAVISGYGGLISFSDIGDTAKISGVVRLYCSKIFGSSTVKYISMSEFDGVDQLSFSPKDILWIRECNLSNAKITGFGFLENAFNTSEFDVDGIFRLVFSFHHKNVSINRPFKATGRINANDLYIRDTPVNLSGSTLLSSTTIHGEIFNMSGGEIRETTFKGIADISGKVTIIGSHFEGENTIKDTATIGKQSHFKGKNIIAGDTLVAPESKVYNQVTSGGFFFAKPNQGITTATDTKASTVTDTKEAAVADTKAVNISYYQEAIKSVEEEYDGYTTDIVKLIKYPAMVDTSVPETRNFLVSLRTAKRVLKSGNFELLEKAATELDHAFVDAESNAFTLAATFLDETKKTTLKRAGNALAIALDENATEHERRAGYKSGMKSLEGVLPVSEEAVSALKERIGLKEIEV